MIQTVRRITGAGGLALALTLPLAGPGAPGANAQACDLPAGFDHTVTLQEGALEFTLATESAVYGVGEPIPMRLRVRNTGAVNAVIANPYQVTPIHSFSLLPEGCTALDDPSCWDNREFLIPGVMFFFGSPTTILPGACVIHSFTWSGVPDGGGATAPGSYVLLAGYWEWTTTEPPLPDMRIYLPNNGLTLPIEITGTASVPGAPAPPVAAATWGRIKSQLD